MYVLLCLGSEGLLDSDILVNQHWRRAQFVQISNCPRVAAGHSYSVYTWLPESIEKKTIYR